MFIQSIIVYKKEPLLTDFIDVIRRMTDDIHFNFKIPLDSPTTFILN